jgi:hypothetical protein
MDFGTWRCYIRQMATAFRLDEFVKAPALERARAVEHGLPVTALRDLMADPAITVADLSRAIAPRRTLERRLKERGRLNARESDRLGAFVTILDTVTTMMIPTGQDSLNTRSTLRPAGKSYAYYSLERPPRRSATSSACPSR